jgi:hypothetical protein
MHQKIKKKIFLKNKVGKKPALQKIEIMKLKK